MASEVLVWPEEFAPQGCFMDVMELAAVYSDGRTQTSLRQRRSQPIWSAQLDFRILACGEWERMAAFLGRLKGPINCARLWDYSSPGEFLLGPTWFFSDGTGFDDGTGFADGPVLAENAAVGDEEIVVQMYGTAPIPTGMKIGLLNDRLYLVTVGATPSLGPTPAVGLATISIYPPIAEAALAGDEVTTYRPTARFYRVGNEPIARTLEKFGSITLNFTEEPRR